MSDPVFDIHHELIESGIAGSRQAQFKLYSLYCRAMYNTALRILNSREDAEEALQDAFTEAFMKLATFRYESTFGTWLKRIVVNKSINLLRKRKIEWINDDSIGGLATEEENGTDQESVQLDVKRIVNAMEQLPDGFRLVFSLYMLEGYDHNEISGILGISESTSKSQLHRAKNKIREMLLIESNHTQNGRVHQE